ncbi:uncharacterized protein LOC144173807 [Haemaphysalis longicornis]
MADAASLDVTVAGTDSAGPRTPYPENFDQEQRIDIPPRIRLHFLYLTAFLQGMSCAILEPFCQTALYAPGKVSGALASNGLHGCYIVGTLLTTPWTARLMLNDFKMRRLFSWGLFCEGFCCFLYEILKPFRRDLLTGFIRILQGCGASLVVPGYFFILCAQFPREILTLIPRLAATFTFGMAVWSYCGGFLFGARILMFPFLCVGCLLMLCSFWAQSELPLYRQRFGGFRTGIGSFVTDANVIMDLAIMANAVMLFVSNRLSLPDVANKFLDKKLGTSALAVLSNPVCILASTLWLRSSWDQVTMRGMSLLGTVLSIAGLALPGSLESMAQHPKQRACAFAAYQILIGNGCVVSFLSSFLHCYHHAVDGNNMRYSHIVLSGLTCTAIYVGHFAAIMYDTFVMEKSEYVQAVSILLHMEFIVFVFLCTTAVYCLMKPDEQIRIGYVNPDGTLRH